MFRRIAYVLALASALTGCQSYQPAPLAPDVHRAEWAQRGPDDARVADFLRELEGSGGAPAAFDASDGLSVGEAGIVALAFNRDLRVARAQAGIAGAGSEFAGVRDNPQFSVDLLRIAESVPDPWIVEGGLGFTIPLSGRLEADRALARAEYGVARARAAEEAWRVLAELRAAWLRWSADTVRAERFEETLREIDAVIDVVDRAAAAGQLLQQEARLFHIERATRAAELFTIESRAALVRLEIVELLGLRPEAPVELHRFFANPAPEDSATNRSRIADGMSPLLAVERAEHESAEQTLRLEIARQYPDLVLGPLVGGEEGQTRIGFAGGIPIPLWNRNQRAIAEAQAAREAARVSFEAAHEGLVHEVAQADAAYAREAARRIQLEQSLIPLVDEQWAHLQRLTEQGEFSLLVQLESVTRRLEAQLTLIDALSAEYLAAERIRALIGAADIIEILSHQVRSPSPSGDDQ